MTIVDSSTADTATSLGAIMTSNASAHTKGGWDEAVASTSEETYWIHLIIKSPAEPSNVTDKSYLIDIGVGATSSEVVKISNIPFFGNIHGQMSVSFPLTIASGARVALRCQANVGSTPLQYSLYLSNDDTLGTSTVNETWGAQTGSSIGTDVDPGGTDDTKGSPFELIASSGITADYLVVFMGNSNNSAQSNQSYLVDVMTGPATEVVQISNIVFQSNTNELPSNASAYFHSIASGTRISSKCQSSLAAAAGTNDRLMDLAIIAFTMVAPSGGGGSGGIKLVGNGGGLVG